MEAQVTRLTDEQLRRIEMDADTARQYYARHGSLPTGTGLDVIERVPTMLSELRSLRALLATPADREVSWHNNGRGPRVVFECGSENFLVDDKHAIALGAALIRAALQAQGEKL
jgi:hypothetical protein